MSSRRSALRRPSAMRRPVRGFGGQTIKYPFSITGIIPTFVNAGAAPTLLRILGGIFPVGSVVYVNNVAQTTTPISGAELNITLASASSAVPAYLNVQVRQGADHSNTVLFPVAALLPTLASISPLNAFVDAGNVNVVGTGTAIYPITQGRVDGNPVTTVPAPSTSATVTIPAAVVAVAGDHAVELYTPPPGGGTTVARTFQSRYRVAAISALSPPSSPVGAGTQEILVTCSNHYNAAAWVMGGSVVTVDNVAMTTTYVDATHLRFVLPSSVTAVGGPKAVRIVNPTAGGGGGPSAPFTLNVGFLAPTVATLETVDAYHTDRVAWNAGPTVVRVLGTNFYSGGNSTVNLGGVAQTTTFVSETELRFTYTPGALGEFNVTVSNSSVGGGGGTSAAKSIATTPTVVSITPSGGTQYDPPTVTRTVEGGGPYTATTVIAINGIDCPTTLVDADTVTITVPGAVSIEPNALQVRARRAAGAPESPGSVPYVVDTYDPLTTPPNFAAWDAAHIALDPTPSASSDVVQADDIYSGTYPFKNSPNVSQNPLWIPADTGLNGYATIDFNGSTDILGTITPIVNPPVPVMFPNGDWTLFVVCRCDSSSGTDVANGYDNPQIFSDAADPGSRVGLGFANSAGQCKVIFWWYDGAFKKALSANPRPFGTWMYIIVKKVGTTLSISVNNEPYVNTTGVGNLAAVTTQRIRIGKSANTFNKFYDGRWRLTICGTSLQTDIDRFINYCIFRLGIT